MTFRTKAKHWLLGLMALGSMSWLSGESLSFDEIPVPAPSGSGFVDLASAQDGNIYLSWVESSESDQTAFRISRFDREAEVWREPVTIASGQDWFLNWADTPVIAAGLRGRVAAAWSVNHAEGGYYAMVSLSEDHGATWSEPVPVTNESNIVEFVELAPLLNGTWLAIWLDGRDRNDSGNMQLRSRVLGSDEPDILVDERVCDCCSIASSVLPNGVVVTAYRDRSDDEVRDIAYQRYSRGTWLEAPPPVSDGWVIDGCPVNGAHLSRRSGNVAAAWFTGANDTAQVLVARSNNLTRSWNLVVRVDDPEAQTRGFAQSAVLRDGSLLIAWQEGRDTLAMRSLFSDGSLGMIHRHRAGATFGVAPKMVVLANQSGQAPRLLFSLVEGTRVVTRTVTLPGDYTETIDECGCSPEEAATRGHAVTGEIVSLLTDRDALLVDHEEIPGVMDAMTMAFQVDRRVLGLVKPGQRISGRMERRADGKWWLFSIRILDNPTP